MNSVQIRSAERALAVGTWLIVGGAMLYSVLTVTPLMTKHTPEDWQWTAPILPLVVDAAVVIVVRLDSVLARLGGHGGRWPVVLRWLTGGMTLALNVADSALKKDLVGVAVHAVAPLLLIVTAETGLAYRRAIAAAVAALETKQRAERDERESAAREREERQDRRAREERDHQAQVLREQREHEAHLAREQTAREEAARRAERDEREAQKRVEREAREHREREREQHERHREQQEREREQRRENAARELAEREARERAALLSGGPVNTRLAEDHARKIVHAAFHENLTVRAAADLCGWSVGWVTARYHEHRDNTGRTLESIAS
ncbi:DUF2637 domain-containing protein [Streptomyces sp. NPDC003860]